MWLRRLRRIVPLAAVALLVTAFAVGLTRDPSAIPSELIDQELPDFALPPIADYDAGFSSDDLKGEVSLVNIFASWCVSCVYEHPTLVRIAEAGGPPIYGLAWKDTPGATTRWLARLGDPYAAVGDDATGRVAIEFGVTGAPETYVVDREGRVRFKYVGPITESAWRRELQPMIAELEAE